MNQLTENDRGTFLVTTQSGTKHKWELRDNHGEVHVSVTRMPKRGGDDHWTMADFPNGRPVTANTVHAWPVVGGCFHYTMHGDTPWTRSSTVQSIERLSH